MFKAFTYIQQLIGENFTQYQCEFASLIEKCSKTLFKLIYANVSDPGEQKKYLCFYFNHLLGFCGVDTILEYIDSERLKKILMNF